LQKSHDMTKHILYSPEVESPIRTTRVTNDEEDEYLMKSEEKIPARVCSAPGAHGTAHLPLTVQVSTPIDVSNRIDHR